MRFTHWLRATLIGCSLGFVFPIAQASDVLDLGDGTVFRFETGAPELLGEENLPAPVFNAAGKAAVAGVAMSREILREGSGYRIRLSVTNTRLEPIYLKGLVPVRIRRDEDVRIAGTGITAWKIFRMARHKNDVPGPFRPALRDESSRDATADNALGINRNDEVLDVKDAGFIYRCDPGVVFMADNRPENTHVFFAFDGQTEHLSDVAIEVDSTLQSLASLTARAEFDGVLVRPGETRTMHDLIVTTGKSCDALLADHVERTATRHGARNSTLRNIFCTWYFYGPEITAADIRRDLAELKKRPVHFESFLIDYNWDDKFGDWNANLERFPNGMKAMADEIRAAGYVPGIWTCPYLIEPASDALKKYPDLPLRDRDGNPVVFAMTAMEPCYVLDPTAPSAEAFLMELGAKLTGWGYRYLKFDFLRSVTIYENAVFHDRTKNRAQAYRHGLELLRKAAGDEVTLGIWGGLFEGSAGLVDINRPGSDVRGHWDAFGDYPSSTRYPVRIRQSLARSFYDDKLWTSDHDALQLRRRTKLWGQTKPHISSGRFTDEEAFSTVVYRFVAGGVVQVSEKLDELDQDRYELYRAVIPTFAPVALPFKGWDDYLPEYFVSHFANHASLPPWAVVSLCNWNGGEAKTLAFAPHEVPGLPEAPAYAAYDFQAGKFLGVFKPNEILSARLGAHAAKVIRLTPLHEEGRHLVGTDLNMSGGMEIVSVSGKRVVLSDRVRPFGANVTFIHWANGRARVETVRATSSTLQP